MNSAEVEVLPRGGAGCGRGAGSRGPWSSSAPPSIGYACERLGGGFIEEGVMGEDMLGGPIEVFSACPPIRGEGGAYLQKVADVARWSEQSGCRGMLVYADNSLLDPWLVSQAIVENT